MTQHMNYKEDEVIFHFQSNVPLQSDSPAVKVCEKLHFMQRVKSLTLAFEPFKISYIYGVT